MRKLATALLLLLLGAVDARAGTGIFQGYVVINTGSGNVFYATSINPDGASNTLTTLNIGTITEASTLILNGAEIKTFKNGGGNVTGAALFYRLVPPSGSPGGFQQINLPFNENIGGGGDQKWQAVNANINIVSLVDAANELGNWGLEMYLQAFTNEGDRFDNSGGSNYNEPFTAGGTLPVELVSFLGVASNHAARLVWTTASETNNAGFYVEQQNGSAWNTVSGLVAGRGTTTERSDYAYTVDGLTAGTYAFRLRQVDTDGTVHYSPSVAVEVGVEGEGRLTLLGQRAVRLETNDAQAVTVRVFDVLGRAVAAQEVSVDGTSVMELPGLAAGAYVVRADGARFSATKTLVVR